MVGPRTPFSRHLTIVVPILLAIVAVTPAAAGRDRSAPSAPGNLQVTGTTAYGVSLTWTASRDSSGIARYTICCADTSSQTVPGSQTSAVFTAGVRPNRTYSLFVVAFDNAGNGSKMSNVVSATTPADVTNPSKPVVTVTDVGPNHVSLSWSATDDGPILWFTVFDNGSPRLQSVRETSAILGPFAPASMHTFTVQARDLANRLSPLSDPVAVTTDPKDTSDTTGPTPVTGLFTYIEEVDGETWLIWTESTDDTTPQDLIRYDIYLNGAFSHSILGFNRMIEYGVPMSFNTWTIIAVDANGNESAPVSITTNNTGNFG
jgi:hypothetical protein